MLKENFYIGIVKTIYRENQNDNTALVTPLMELIKENNYWCWRDIDQKKLGEIFQIKLDVWWSNIPDGISEGQVWKFKISENKDYHPSLSTNKSGSINNRKFVISSIHPVCELFEIKTTNLIEGESIIRSELLREGLPSKPFCNSQVLILINDYSWIGPLEFIINEHSNRLQIVTDNSYLKSVPVYRIISDLKIIPKELSGRIFVDPNEKFGEIIDYHNWQSDDLFFITLTDFLKKIDRNSFRFDLKFQIIDQYLKKFDYSNLPEKDIVNERNKIWACRNRLKEFKNLKIPQNYSIDIAKNIINFEPLKDEFANDEIIEENNKVTQLKEEISSLLQKKNDIEIQIEKEATEIRYKMEEQVEEEILQMCNKKDDLERQIESLAYQIEGLHQIIIDSEAEIESKKLEKNRFEQEVSDMQIELTKIKKNIELQHTDINHTLDKFEQCLGERFNRLAVEPTDMLAEALANDAFLQFLLGKRERSLDLRSSVRPQINKQNFEIKQGDCFKTIEKMITSYSSRLEKTDLNVMLAIWTMTITLSGLTPVFKGNAVCRALNTFVNHLAYGRCFELPLSPEIISIERLFSIGQSGSVSSLGILDSAILCAVTHRESLFILVLDGLDRAPSQYFLDTLLDWYSRGLMNIPSDTFFSQHIQGLKERHGLTNDIVSWPSNLLLVATIKGLNDGFPVSNNALEKIIEIETDYQGKHQDIHPQILDQIALKPAGEVKSNQFNEWREETLHQDIEPANEIIESSSKFYQSNTQIEETTRRLFAAAFNLCTNLELFKEDAINHAKTIISGYYFSKHGKTDAAHQK